MAAKVTTVARLAGNTQFGVVAFDRMLDNCETQAETAVAAGTAAVHPKESFGEPRNVLRCNTLG